LSSVSNPGTTLGRYTLEARIAQGGMASVFLGRMAGPGGFSKKVVVKRILPEFADNPLFVEMFLSEARLAALLNHPNVVQVYDFGEDHGQYYLAMELIDGVSVRALQHRYRRRQEPFPALLAAYIMAQACAGLSYAHQLKDENGVALNLVHRDVSPDNLLVSRTGVVKLVDFGVARVASATVQTTAGTVKGKLAYMAPEQVSARDIDLRVDVYAAGVALYELVAGRRPFVAQNELELAMTIMERTAPPLGELAPHAPRTLQDICERAMQKERDKRFPDARSMQDALLELVGSTRDVAAELESVVAVTAHEAGVPTTIHTPLGSNRATEGAAEVPEPETAPLPSPVPRRLRTALAAIVVCVALLAGLAAGRVLYASKQSAAVPPVPVQASAPAPVQPPPVPPVDAAAEPKPAPALEPVPAAAAAPEVEPTARRPHHAASAEGALTLRTSPWADVTIDGASAGTTPLVKVKLSAGTHSIQLLNEKLGLQTKVSVSVQPGQTVTKALTFPMGQLKVAAPAGTKVFLGSELLGVAPMAPVPLVAGKQTVGFIDGASGKFATRAVTIPAGSTGELSLP
jgi:serine/threonine-protein kinase